jgi:hypothetical protein
MSGPDVQIYLSSKVLKFRHLETTQKWGMKKSTKRPFYPHYQTVTVYVIDNQLFTGAFGFHFFVDISGATDVLTKL